MKPQSLAMITRLVGIDTVSRNSNLALIHDVRDYLSGFGVKSHLVTSADGQKANLYATVGPNVERGVVLSGHTDVVPVDGQPWDTDPFKVTQKSGRLYGRGTCDMKSFYSVALALLPEITRKNLKRPLHFALSYDEEYGCSGAPPMIKELVTAIPKPLAVIVGEPSDMKPMAAHKGLAIAKTTVIGHEAHSSQVQRGVSAVMTAAKLIRFLENLMEENQRKADPKSIFVPPFTTVHVGTVHGGTATNIISRECTFTWDTRVLPGEDWTHYLGRFNAYVQELLPAMRAIAPEATITTEVSAAAPPLADRGGEAQAIAMRLTGNTTCGVVPYGTEAGEFQQNGFSAVVCGPGSIDQAHQPNEYIEISQVDACERFIDKLTDELTRA